MKREIIIAGFGGQGVMSIGKNLVEAGMHENYHVSWAPSYGPEMRGGTANCSVVLSDLPIGSPIFSYPMDLIAMNGPSLMRFAKKVRPGGLILASEEALPPEAPMPEYPEVRVLRVPCKRIAEEAGESRAANMVMVGAYVAASGLLRAESVEHIIREMFAGKKEALIPVNIEAMKRGMRFVEEAFDK